MEAYLDNSATTRVCESAIERMSDIMKNCWGNPSSLHAAGLRAEQEFVRAQKSAAGLLGCSAGEIYFTSGGTESNNTAVFGAADALKRRGNRIVTTKIEHASVLQSFRRLEQLGFEAVYLDVDKNGVVREDELFDAVNDKTVLVSMMLVNNEVGSIQPVEKIKAAVKRAGAPAFIHTDAVQAFGKLSVRPSQLGVDLVSASSHKIHGPKGAGLLYVRKGVKLTPLLYGGEQQNRLRPGTEAMPAIAGFGAAIDELSDINAQFKIISSLRKYFLTQLNDVDAAAVISPQDALPYIISISMRGYRSETLLNFLSERGIYVSSGSACAKGHRSYVLEAMGLDPQLIDGTLRVSLSRYTVRQELDELCAALAEAQRVIRTKK